MPAGRDFNRRHSLIPIQPATLAVVLRIDRPEQRACLAEIRVAGEVRQHQFVNRKLVVARREQAGGGVDYFHTQRKYTADDLLRRFPVRARREHAKTKGEMRRDDPERAGEIDTEGYEP